MSYVVGYLQEDRAPLSASVNLYWEVGAPDDDDGSTYPSLPDPYVNLYFPLEADGTAQLKGVASEADFMHVQTGLFGVRLYLRGYYQLHLAPCADVVDSMVEWEALGGAAEANLSAQIMSAAGFEERVALFRAYMTAKHRRPIREAEARAAQAFTYLIHHYQDPNVVGDYAALSGYTARTVARWFSKHVGISPKKLARIARFNGALSGLHTAVDPAFYLDCGYYDQAHFIRDFKAFTGLAPEAYLQMLGLK